MCSMASGQNGQCHQHKRIDREGQSHDPAWKAELELALRAGGSAQERRGQAPVAPYGGTYKSWNKSQNPPPLGFSSALVDCCVKYGSPNLSSEKV